MAGNYEQCIETAVRVGKMTYDQARAMVDDLKARINDSDLNLSRAQRIKQARELIDEIKRSRPERELAEVQRILSEALQVQQIVDDQPLIDAAIKENAGNPSDLALYDGVQKILTEKEFQLRSIKEEVGSAFRQLVDSDPNHAAIMSDEPSLRQSLANFIDGRFNADSFAAGVDQLVGDWVTLATKYGSAIVHRPQVLLNSRLLSPAKLREVTREEFVQFILDRSHTNYKKMALEMGIDPAIDKNKRGAKELVNEKLGDMYDRLVDDASAVPEGAQFDANSIYGVIRARAENTWHYSDQRYHLPYRDGAAFLEIFDAFGNGDLRASMLRQVDGINHWLAGQEVFGPYPNAWFKTMIFNPETQGGLVYKAASPSAKELIRRGYTPHIESAPFQPGRAVQLQQWRPPLEAYFKQITGEAARPEAIGGIGQRVSQAIRAIGTTLLQGSGLAQFSDTASYYATFERMNGAFGAFTDANLGWIQNLAPGAERNRAISSMSGGLMGLEQGLHEMLTGTYHTMPSTEGAAAGGVFDRFFDTMYKFTGVRVWEHSHKRAAVFSLSRWLSHAAEEGLESVGEANMRFLMHEGFDPELFKRIGKEAIIEYNGEKFFSVDAIPERADRVAMRAFYDRILTLSTPTPTAFQRATLYLGHRPGSAAGDLYRMLTQFMSYPLLVQQRLYPALRSMEGPAAVKAISSTIALMTVYGLLSEVLKNWSRDETVNFTDPKTYLNAIARGGAGGVYGDFILRFNPSSGLQSSPILDVAGTLARDSWRMGDWMFTGLAQGRPFDPLTPTGRSKKFPGATIAKDLKRYTPYVNLPFVQGLTDRYVMHTLYELLDPGWTERQQQKLEREGRDMLY